MSLAGRRKSSLAGAGAGAGADAFGAKHAVTSLRKGGRLPVYVASVFFFLRVILMYSRAREQRLPRRARREDVSGEWP